MENSASSWIEQCFRRNQKKMLARSRVLIIDFNTLKFDTFDMMSLQLLDKKVFSAFQSQSFLSKEFFRGTKQYRIKYAINEVGRRNPADFILGRTYESDIDEDKQLIDDYATYLNFTTREKHITKTDMVVGLETASYMNQIAHIYIVRDIDDTIFKTAIEKSSNKISVYGTDKIFMRSAESFVDFIERHSIDTIILDSVDMAMNIASKTYEKTFIIGKYMYNFELKPLTANKTGKIIRHTDSLSALATERGHEFGMFDPYSIISFDFII